MQKGFVVPKAGTHSWWALAANPGVAGLSIPNPHAGMERWVGNPGTTRISQFLFKTVVSIVQKNADFGAS